jgi:hypothetical protein
MDSPFADLSLSSSSGSSQASSEAPAVHFSKMHEVLTRLSNSHTSLNSDTWGFKVRNYVDIENDCRISRLAKFTLENGNLVYLLAENCEVITSECIRQITQDATFSMTKQGGEKLLFCRNYSSQKLGRRSLSHWHSPAHSNTTRS